MDNKVIIVTGSSRGIGAAAATLAHKRGAKVVVHGKTDSERLQTIARQLGVLKIACDVSDEAAVSGAVDEVMDMHGKVDGLINSAGIVRPKPFLQMSDSDWRAEFDTNFLGTVHFCQATIRHMLKSGGGTIANVSSIRGINSMVSNRGMSYSISKAAVSGLTSALSKEFAPQIRVNAVAPGFTQTEMSESWSDAVWHQARNSLLGRVGQPAEIAAALVFLVSSDSSFITGRTLVVDGGYELAGK